MFLMWCCEWIVSTKTEFSACRSHFSSKLVWFSLTTFSLSCLLCTPGVLLHHVSSLSPFLLSFKLLFSRSHRLASVTRAYSLALLCVNSSRVLLLRICVVEEIFPSCTSTVINIGDPNSVIGYSPTREGWGAKEGQRRKMEVESGGGGSALWCLRVHIWYIILLLSAKLHSCCIMALWGGQAKGGDDGDGVRKRGETELMTERMRKKRDGEDRTLRHQESLSTVLFIDFQRCVITKMTANDNSGQFKDLPTICCLDRNEIYHTRKCFTVQFTMCMSQWTE